MSKGAARAKRLQAARQRSPEKRSPEKCICSASRTWNKMRKVESMTKSIILYWSKLRDDLRQKISCFLFRENSAKYCFLVFVLCFTSSVSSTRSKCPFIVQSRARVSSQQLYRRKSGLAFPVDHPFSFLFEVSFCYISSEMIV